MAKSQNVEALGTMRALVLDGVGFDHLSVRQLPLSRPGPRQLLARVDAAGVCTSLIKLIEQGGRHSMMYGWDPARYPVILGDEGSVTLVEVGSTLKERYSVGQRFSVQPAVNHAPIHHRQRYANNAQGVDKVAVGYTLAGHLAEYLLITEEILEAGCLLPLPDPQMPYAHVAIGEPLSCVVSAQDHHVHLVQASPSSPRTVIKGLKPGGVTVIIGGGPMGRMHVDLALSYCPSLIIFVDRHDEKLRVARELFGPRATRMGVRLHTVNASQQDVQATVAELTGHRGADDVIVSVGTRQAIEEAQHYCGRGAVLNLFGGLKRGDDFIALDTSLVHYKEITVTGSSGGSPMDMARTLDLIASGSINPAQHITRIGRLEHALDFIHMIRDRQMDGKAVVYPHCPAGEKLAVSSWTAADERRYLARYGG